MNEILVLLGVLLGILSFLIWFIVDIKIGDQNKHKGIKGYCPICGHPLKQGERIRSEQIETPKVEIKTFIKGCPYCLSVKSDKKNRRCPVCKNSLKTDQTILATSTFEDPKKLSIKGCRKCYPEGYMGYESKYQ